MSRADVTCDAAGLTEIQTVRKARVSSMRRLRIYLGGARGTLPDNGQSSDLKWNLVYLAASDFLAWKEWR